VTALWRGQPDSRNSVVSGIARHQDAFAAHSPDAYETLLWDVMKNDATLFMRADQVEAAWRLLMPVLDVWAAAPPSDSPNYAAGTWGPENALGLLAQGHSWPLPPNWRGLARKRGNIRDSIALGIRARDE